MPTEEMISLECPLCQNELYRPLTWFKGGNFSCTTCGQGLTASQFSITISDLESALEASHAERIHGEAPSTCCCGGKGHCCGGEEH